MKHRLFGILFAGLFIQSASAASLPAAATQASSLFNTAAMPYAAFDALPAHLLRVDGGDIEVAFAPGELELPQARIIAWVAASAHAVAAYYGRFPARYTRVLIVPGLGRGVHAGTSYGYRGAAIKVNVGRATLEADLNNDWIMTHEMVHLTFPSVADKHNWIQEGIATYVEPIARAQAGQLSVEQVWGDLVDKLPQGLPAKGDRGLDHTATWGRAYWGGALFCLLADIDIRQRTANRYGLQDALRAITAGGNIEVRSSPLHTFRIGDKATGVPTLIELYERMKATPVDTDLAELWRRLGVKVRGNVVFFDDAAPLAAIRRAITRSAAAS